MTEERRVVTVLFADVVGSTALGEDSDPEDVRALMSTYARLAREVIGARGGTVEKFIGDAVMAVFGVPQAHDDDPDRALAAALALREAVAADPATSALALRIGVNTGEVVAAREARDEMLVSGDTVNVAARIQQAARPGEILAGERTIAAARGRSIFGEQRALEVKGKSLPVRASVLLAHDTSPARAEEPPFIGRDADLAQLSLVGARAFAESRPQLVTISAPAGTGKSRLVTEFVARVRAERPALRVAVAQCMPYGSGTYIPMRALLASLLRVAEGDLGAATIERALALRGMPGDDASRVAALVAATLGLQEQTVEREREEFFTAWRACVESLASGEPTVLVLEDLHWATDSLFDLIEHVTQPRVRAPLLMIALTRPELFDRRPTWGTARRNATSITLEPLDESDTEQLIAALVPHAPAEALARMSERAEGNPFFAVELARGLRERGEDVALPDTVQASVLARLDLLPETERRALQLGAVVGRTIAPDALARLAGPGTIATLEALAERDLVVPQRDGAYTFRHIVIREVAYGTLPRTERARAHVELARWLAGIEDTPLELLAYHYRQALTLSARSLAAEDLAAAVRALGDAATFAKHTGADREAEGLLRAAIQYAPPADQVRLHESLGDALELTDEAADAYAEAYARWQDMPTDRRDALDGARLLRKRWIVYVRWGGSIRLMPGGREAVSALAAARELLAAAPDEVEAARLALLELFIAGSRRMIDEIGGERLPTPSEAIARGEAARRTLAAHGEHDAESEALDALAGISRLAGQVERSIEYSRERMRLTGLSLLERADAAAMVCNGLVYLGDFAGTLDAFAAHIASLRPGEPEGFYAYPHTWAVIAARAMGRWDDALRIGDRVAEIVETGERSGRAPIAAASLAIAAYIARARLDHARFERYRSAAASIMEGLAPDAPQMPSYQLMFLDDAAQVLLSAGGPRAGERTAELLTVLLFDHDIVPDDATVANVEQRGPVRSALAHEQIRLVRAARSGATAVRTAIGALDSAGMRADAARAAGLLARMTRDAGDRAVADDRLRALGDRAFVARLDEPFEPRSG